MERSIQDQLEYLTDGVEHVVPRDGLAALLSEGRSLRIKLGLDPTAPSVTLGWAVVLRKLRQFQELGHTAVLIVGDFTAQVGDPSDRSETRKRLAAEEVDRHAEGVLSGFRRMLLPEPLEMRYNSEWLARLGMTEVLELTSKVTVAQLLERDDFRQRFQGHQPISLMEFLYPLLQGYDSVAIEADVELGGSDQLWNLLVGRDLQSRYGKQPQVAVTMPLLVGIDGVQKMSQSLGNYIAIDDEPSDMFGKVMSIPDEAMPQYFRLATDLPRTDREALIAGLEDGSLHPGEVKRQLAREIVRMYWSADAAAEAEEAFDLVFRDHQVPEDLREFALGTEDPVFLPVLLRKAGLVESSSEGRRMIDQGAVKIDGSRIETSELPRSRVVGKVLQVGKRRFVRLVS
jgi:tyrosyl-tRNA synthetase